MADASKTTVDPNRVRKSTAEHLFRFARVDADGADDAKRILQVRFSSEYPVKRRAGKSEEALGIAKAGEIYWEVLDHSSERTADLSPLNAGTAPVLDEHDGSKQVGNVKRAMLGPDKTGRAAMEFDGLTELSKARFEQMRSGKRPYVSFGYDQTGFNGDVDLGDGRIGKRISFRADEISSVWRPADPTAGTRRSLTDEWACLCCGEMCDREDMDDDFICEACAEKAENRTAPSSARKFRAADKEFSHRQLKGLVGVAADADKRFKVKRPNNDLVASFYVDDICQDGKDFYAIIYAWTPEMVLYKVEFTFDGEKVTLGEMTAVEPVITYEPVTAENKRSKQVDSPKSTTNGNAPTIITMKRNLNLDPDPINGGTGGGTGLIEPVKGFKVRDGGVELDLDEPKVRAVVTASAAKLSEQKRTKAKARNEELDAVAKEIIKEHGQRVGGPDGDKFYVSDRVRSLLNEAINQDPEKYTDSEVRSEFKEKCRTLVEKSEAAPKNTRSAVLPEELASRCSFQHVVRSFADSVKEGDKTPLRYEMLRKLNCGAEAEADEEIRRRAGKVPGSAALFEAGGIHLPMNSGLKRDAGGRKQRDTLATDFATAGALIQSDFLTIEELLRNELVLSNLGASWLGGLSGDLILPRAMSATVGQSVAEGTALLQYDQNFDQLRLTPRRVGTSQYYSRLALIQAGDSTNLAAYILKDHMEVLGIYMDYMGLNGSGANSQPLGLLNQPGIGQTIFGGTPTYSQVVGFITNIRKFNVKGPVAFATTSVGRGRLTVLPATLVGSTVVSGQTNALWVDQSDDSSRLIGRMAMDSQQIPGDILLAGVFKFLLLAQWGGINVLLNPYARDDRDEWKLTLNAYMDVACRRAQAFNRSGDSCNQ